MERLLIIGLDEPEYAALRQRVSQPTIYYELLPKLQVIQNQLHVESPRADGRFLPVSKVVFHGIYEDDLPALTALALWGGPCFPGAFGMMNCRQRIPCLVRALQVTSFGSMWRGYAERGSEMRSEVLTVAKWGEWHCGENKSKFTGLWKADVPTLFEPFISGQAVRIQIIGERAWQINMEGDDWLKSLHHSRSQLTALDNALVDDSRRLKQHFGLEMLAVDYIVADDGTPHLLEVNHIPSVTAFEEVRQAYLDYVAQWIQS